MIDTPTTGLDRIELLATFIRIVEAGSLSAVAAQLGTSQPTVSRRLQALEHTLGLRLVQRSTHVMKLTADGERCFAHAKSFVETWRTIQADLKGAKDEPDGLLRVVVPHAFGQDQLIAPLIGYLERHPRVAVEWLLRDTRPDFIAEGIDCAIQVGVLDDPSVVALRLAEVPRIVVGAPSLLGGAEIPTHPSALEVLPWMALRTFYRDEVRLSHRQTGEHHSFPIRPRLSTDNLYALRNATFAGLGAAIASAWLVEEDVRLGRLLHLVPDWRAAPLSVHLVYPYARFYPARLRRFIEIMRAMVPELIKAGETPALQ
jgi:DNA-binding transcriptional LysR family regulator